MFLWRRRTRRRLDPELRKEWRQTRDEDAKYIHELVEAEKEEERELYRKLYGEDFPMVRVYEASRWTLKLDAGDIAVALVLLGVGLFLFI